MPAAGKGLAVADTLIKAGPAVGPLHEIPLEFRRFHASRCLSRISVQQHIEGTRGRKLLKLLPLYSIKIINKFQTGIDIYPIICCAR